MKPRIVFSRTRKVKRSYTIDDQIIRKYIALYGISIKEARERYSLFILQTKLQAVWKIMTSATYWLLLYLWHLHYAYNNPPNCPTFWSDSDSLSEAVLIKTTHMEKFKVQVIRIEYAVKEIEVDATSQGEANEIALEMAYDEYYEPTNVYDVEYKLSDF